jgi:hypothetical protein
MTSLTTVIHVTSLITGRYIKISVWLSPHIKLYAKIALVKYAYVEKTYSLSNFKIPSWLVLKHFVHFKCSIYIRMLMAGD